MTSGSCERRPRRSASRRAATWSGANDSTPTLMNTKLRPQIAASATNRAGHGTPRSGAPATVTRSPSTLWNRACAVSVAGRRAAGARTGAGAYPTRRRRRHPRGIRPAVGLTAVSTARTAIRCPSGTAISGADPADQPGEDTHRCPARRKRTLEERAQGTRPEEAGLRVDDVLEPVPPVEEHADRDVSDCRHPRGRGHLPVPDRHLPLVIGAPAVLPAGGRHGPASATQARRRPGALP